MNLGNRCSIKLSSSQEKINKLKADFYKIYSNASEDTIKIEKKEFLKFIKEFSQVDELILQVLEAIDNEQNSI